MELLNDLFNRFVDIAMVVATRLGELPFALVLGVAVVGVLGVFGARRLLQQLSGRREPLGRRLVRALAIALAIGTLVHMAQRTDLLLRELRELQYFVRRDAVEQAMGLTAHEASPLRLIDEQAVIEQLRQTLGSDIEFSADSLESGIEFASFHSSGPQPVSGYVSVLDLTQAGLEIEITEELGAKSLTSDFGADHHCVVAINGEAGMSPARDAPLGSYVGNWVVGGKVVPVGLGHRRPFISFDALNHGSYYRAREGDTQASGWLNALWGRGDLLVEGQYTPSKNPRWLRASPRTLMGLDETGTHLILAVVDGRQMGYSLGLELEAAAGLMAAFGAHNAMWCDQGGSSTFYLGSLAGVVNRPSDGHERPVYTHFGVSCL